MTFKTNLLPYPDNTCELGSSSQGWKITKINLPTTSGGNTYGPGGAGQVLTSNGTTVYWANGYSLPLAANGTRGGIQIGYSESGNNYAVKLSSEKAYVTVPWTDTKVTQNNTTAANDYRVLLSASANDTAETNTANKNTNLRYNPSTNTLSTGNISGSGNLTITGNTNLNGETYAESITAGSLLVNGNANFVQIPTAPTPAATSNDTSVATTAFVMNAFTANDAMVFKGVVNANGDLPATHKQGWTYRVATAGTYAGKVCEVGDIIICVTDGTAANNDHWAVIQNNIDGAVTGPASATTNAIARYNGTTGKIIKNSNVTIDDTGNITTPGNINLSAGGANIVWNSDTWQQRIKTTDDSTADTPVFTFQQSSNSGSAWTDLMTIKDNGKVVATTFVGALDGNAVTATKATQDSDGNTINTTYIKKSTLSGAYDIMYSSAANTPTRLAANTTTTKKFLRMTGTGSAGAAPAWDTVTKSDVGLGNVENTKLSTWAGSSNITTIGTLSSGTVPWARLSGVPSSFTPSSHTHNLLVTEGDNRTVATTPNDYSNKIIFRGLKTNSSFNSPSTDTYSYVIGLRGWSDSSGGDSHELAFNNTGLYWRHGATTSWGNWARIYTTANKPTKSDVGLGNVENTALSTWAGSSNITTIGTLSSGTVPWARLSNVPSSFTPSAHTHYWANIATTSAAAYNAAPEMATLKLNGNTSATAASTSNVTLVYDTTSQALNFVFA